MDEAPVWLHYYLVLVACPVAAATRQIRPGCGVVRALWPCQSPYKHMIAAVKKLPPTLTSSAATITQSFQLPVSPANAGGPAQLQLLARQTVKLIFCCAAVSTLPKSAALRCKCRAYQQVKCVVMSTSLTREPRPRFLVTIPIKASTIYCGNFHNILISM